MTSTREHQAARGANMKTIAVLAAVVVALYIGSFFILSG
jgi:hypothetical protein